MLQDRSNNSLARNLLDQWIKFSLLVGSDSGDEFVRWLSSDLYALEERLEWPWPIIGYLCICIPLNPRGTSSLLVVIRITNHDDKWIAGQAKGVVRMLRFLEDKVLLVVDIEFDESVDVELLKPENQRAAKEAVGKAICKVTSKKPKRD